MSASNRAKKISKIQTVLKKHYQPVKAPVRNVLENIVFACCLEDSKYDQANDAFARLQEIYTGWNEIRVTTVAELAEEMSELTHPREAAERVKKTLYGLFESQYSWDFDHLMKENLGKAVQKLSSFKSMSPFVLSYVVQHSLGGHSIPIDRSAMAVMKILDLASDKEAEKGNVVGLDRAIPKSQGKDFGSLLHQFAVDFAASPFSNSLRSILLAIDPDCKDRFPKRQTRKKVVKSPAADKPEAKKTTKTGSSTDAKKKTAKSGASGSKTTAKAKPVAAKNPAAKPTKKATKKSAGAKSATGKKTAKSAKKTSAKKTGSKSTAGKPAQKKLAKKKPR